MCVCVCVCGVLAAQAQRDQKYYVPFDVYIPESNDWRISKFHRIVDHKSLYVYKKQITVHVHVSVSIF